MVHLALIRERRDALEAQRQQAVKHYDQLDAQLRELDRQICGMLGGVQELDALLASGATTYQESALLDEPRPYEALHGFDPGVG